MKAACWRAAALAALTVTAGCASLQPPHADGVQVLTGRLSVRVDSEPVRALSAAFELSGNAADNGHSKNYGNPSPVIGMGVRYEPWGLEVDVGAALTEAVLEPLWHEGVDQNIALSVAWQF